MEDDLKWKTTSDINSEISQQLLVRSSPNFKQRLMWPKQTLEIFQMKMTSNGRRHQMEDSNIKSEMEDDLKWKTTSDINSEISQQLLVRSSPNLNKGLCDQTKLYKCFKWRQPPMDDNCKYEKWNISAKPGRIFLKSET